MSVGPVLAKTRSDVGSVNIVASFVSTGSRQGSDRRDDRLHVTALDPQHDAARPLDFQASHASRWIADDLHGNEGLLRRLRRVSRWGRRNRRFQA